MSNYSVLTFQSEETFSSESNLETENTDIGYSKDEIKATSTEDLLTLRGAILSYLKSATLKRRNPNYLKVFKRINKELLKRKAFNTEKPNKNNKESSFKIYKNNKEVKKQFFVISENHNKNKSNENKGFFGVETSYDDSAKNCRKFNRRSSTEFIKRKRANTAQDAYSVVNNNSLNFPSFLQDKSKSKEEENKEFSYLKNLKSKNQKNFPNEYEFGGFHEGANLSKFVFF